MLIMTGHRILAAIKILGTLAVGGVILGNVAQHAGLRKCVAYVHVSTPNVEIAIDDDAYQVESLADTPIVSELPPGPHMLRMARGGQVVFEQPFQLVPGEEIVLSAWERPIETPAELPAFKNAAQQALNHSLALGPRPVQRISQEPECMLPGCNPAR